MLIFSVHDAKAEAYLNPFVQRTKGEALRSFEQHVKSEDSQFFKFPEDYTLVCIGDWDDEQGCIKPLDQPIILANATEYVKQ